ncbi:MAG: EamA family transporter RarD, partial [Rhodobacteraceae bacterium]|nr:EamA family transporter RarD [Paracoccaceae bacterium]
DIPATEVVAHRILWSIPIAGAVLLLQGRTADLRAALKSRTTLKMAFLTASIISTNWGIYVWAITSGHTLDAALGYYINPLFSVFLGAVLLKERLQPPQIAAILLAVLAVLVLTWEAGRLPLVSLGLMVTWGFYAYFRKTLPIGPNQGFFLEVLLMALPALGYAIYLQATGASHFLTGDARATWLLFGCGIVTAAPLMIYANGAKLLKLSTIGIMQYIAPTLIFLTAVFVFGEPFGRARMVAFPLIWLALILYTGSMLRDARRARAR